MTPHLIALIGLAAAWLAYGALHSLLASLRCKAWFRARWPQQMYRYRIAFNTLAVVLLIPILALEQHIDGVLLWSWSGVSKIAVLSLMLAAVAAFIWSTRYYDISIFMGTHQWRNRKNSTNDEGALTISPLHRFVRHPWYSLALVILWTRDIESTTLVSNLMLSAYFIIGARLEEQKLVIQFGRQYQEYQRRVPAMLPAPWRYLSAEEAQRLSEPPSP